MVVMMAVVVAVVLAMVVVAVLVEMTVLYWRRFYITFVEPVRNGN